MIGLDHTITWEIARVGGFVAYVLATGSVALGLLLSLKAYSTNWPRFITNELHRFVTILTLVFIAIHTLAVFLDPFTAFTPAEVLVPFQAHYRPIWIAMGIVSGYLAIAVWASEYIRKRIGYAWWRRFHYLAFAVFILGAAHGLGTGSDSQAWWGIAIYAVTIGVVAFLIGWRLVRSLGPDSRNVVIATIGSAVVAALIFTLVGPAQPGWNAIANGGNGNGASASWLAAHPATTVSAVSAPSSSFTAQFDVALVNDGQLVGNFTSADSSGQMQLTVQRETAGLALAFADGWTCTGQLTQTGSNQLQTTCIGTDGTSIQVTLGDLQRSGADVVGSLQVSTG
jgi:sulfoxide reductase heme-binding subunit YedZ